MVASGVVLRGVTKDYGERVGAVSGVDLEIRGGELFVLVGPSGSGKSTLLRLIAGLETPSAGEIWIGPRRVDALPPRERDVSMVFQNPALFPHLSVFENLAFGLRARGIAQEEAWARVSQTGEQLRLGGLLERRPATLSGGERQRVALGRALARRPAVSLFDEPFSSLDAPLRVSLRSELTRLHEELGATMVHVTHDQAEALAMGQRIAVMNGGRVAQIGTPAALYDRPASRFVAQFLGSPPMNVLPCVVEHVGETVQVAVIDGPESARWTWNAQTPWPDGSRRVDLGMRPERLVVGGSGPLTLPTEVRRLEPHGHETIAELALGPHRLFARLPARTSVVVGDRPPVAFDPADLVAFDPKTGAALGALRDEPIAATRPPG